MKWTKLIKANDDNDNELVDNIEVVYLDEDLTKAQLEVSVRDFKSGEIKSSRSWLIINDKIKQAEQLVANFRKKWSTYLFDSMGSRYLTDRVWKDITAIREQVCVDNKKPSQQIKAFDLHSIIKKIRDTLGDIADSSTASDAEWFDQGEYAYLYIPLNQMDFRKNVTTGEINKEALEKVEEMNGQKVEVIKINKTSKGFETGGIITGKPESVDVRLENGDILKDIDTMWLKHEPLDERAIKASNGWWKKYYKVSKPSIESKEEFDIVNEEGNYHLTLISDLEAKTQYSEQLGNHALDYAWLVEEKGNIYPVTSVGDSLIPLSLEEIEAYDEEEDDMYDEDDTFDEIYSKYESFEKEAKSNYLTEAIKMIKDRYKELSDIGSWSDAEWFEKGEYAYIYIPVNKFDFRKNVTIGETDKEAAEALEELSGQKVEILKIKATTKGPYDIMTADAKPTLVDVRFEDGQVWEDVNTEWLKHEPFGEDEEDRKVESKLDNLYDLSIELGEEVIERINELMDSGFESEEIVDMVSNEYDCEPAQIQAVIDEVEYESNILEEEYFDKEVDMAVEEADRILKGE